MKNKTRIETKDYIYKLCILGKRIRIAKIPKEDIFEPIIIKEIEI